MGLLPSNPFGNEHAFIFRLMGKHGATDNVSDRIYAGYGGFQILINRNFPASFFQLQTDVFQTEAFRVSGAAYGYDAIVALPRYRLPFGVLRGHRDLLS